MSGRGRGRGRGGYKPPTGAQLFLQRSAQESGLDERNLRSLQDLTRPVLFPDYHWHSSGKTWRGTDEEVVQEIVATKRTQSQIYLIRKSREIQHRMHTSPYFLQAAQETDVARYRKKRATAAQPCDKIVREHIGRVVATPAYIPEELLAPKQRASATGKPHVILYNEDGIEIKGVPGGEGEEEEDGEHISIAQEEDEDEVEDYAKDYYASEEESDGGGDGEPTF